MAKLTPKDWSRIGRTKGHNTGVLHFFANQATMLPIYISRGKRLSPAATVTLLTWPLVVFLLFALTNERRALAWGLALGWCFLPTAGFTLPGLPDYTKTTATMAGALFGLGFFAIDSVRKFRPYWFDTPVLVWCLCPFLSSVANGLGAYDGASEVVRAISTWGLPYLLGRICFRHLEHLKDFVEPILGATVLYVPLCVYELRMSPQLHRIVYGFHQHDFAQTFRNGGWRPMVFMNHGLQLAMWLGIGSLLAFVNWRFAGNRNVRFFFIKLPAFLLFAVLAATLLLVKSLGAVILLVVAMGVIAAYSISVSRLFAVLLPLCCVAFLIVRASGLPGFELLPRLASKINEERSESLQTRFDNESMLGEKARQRPLVGWGGWGRARIYDEEGKDISITDGLWIIAFGNLGSLGLVSLYSMLLIGPTRLLWNCPPKRWSAEPKYAWGAGFALACQISAVDSLPNSMQLPIMTAVLGAVTGIAGLEQEVENPEISSSLAKKTVACREALFVVQRNKN